VLNRALALGLAFACACGESGNDEPVCDPLPTGTIWLAEGEMVELTVACALDAELDGADVEISPLPAGAVYDPASRLLTWTPGLDQAAVYDLTVTVVSLGESSPMRIGVADAFDDPNNVPVVEPLRYPLEYGVPVLFLSPSPTSSDEFAPATVIYGNTIYVAEAKLRGKSSLSYPKNSYTLKFAANDPFSDPDRAGGFMDKRKIVLTTTFDDNSYIRTRLAFDLWNELDDNLVRVQTYSVVVYLDGEYWGVYTLGDHIDAFLMEGHGLSGDGNLYKAINHDANFRLTDNQGDPKGTLHDGYEKKDGPAGVFDDLDQLVDFVATSDDTTFGAEIGERVRVAEYQSWWQHVSFLAADDSAGKNSYHYNDLSGPWRVVPWDFNACFGQAWTTHRQNAANVNTYFSRNLLFERLLGDATYGPAIEARFGELLVGALAVDSVNAIIDGYIAEIDEVAARDEIRWRADYLSFSRWSDRSDFTTYPEEVEYVRQWVEDRWTALDALY
jgi:hypothetical protein